MKLNVILITYNHSKFIEESLYSILIQKTDFEFDIIVADDYSTDDTIDKIKKIDRNSSITFHYLSSDNNLGITKNYQRAFKAITAPYVAVMEGDDVWTDPFRLQKHVNFLDNHLECVMTFNRYIVSDFENAKFHIQPIWTNAEGYQLITSRELAQDNLIGNFSTCVYRKKSLETLPKEMFDLMAYDWITNILVGRGGMIGYLMDTMSTYRLHSLGVWSGNKEADNIKELITNINIYNDFTNRIFDTEFTEHKQRLRSKIATRLPLEDKSKNKIRVMLKHIKDFVPPVILIIVKLFIPLKIWEKLKGEDRYG